MINSNEQEDATIDQKNEGQKDSKDNLFLDRVSMIQDVNIDNNQIVIQLENAARSSRKSYLNIDLQFTKEEKIQINELQQAEYVCIKIGK